MRERDRGVGHERIDTVAERMIRVTDGSVQSGDLGAARAAVHLLDARDLEPLHERAAVARNETASA